MEKHINCNESWTTLTINAMRTKMREEDEGEESKNVIAKYAEQESGESLADTHSDDPDYVLDM
jgi:hypothetical protein